MDHDEDALASVDRAAVLAAGGPRWAPYGPGQERRVLCWVGDDGALHATAVYDLDSQTLRAIDAACRPVLERGVRDPIIRRQQWDIPTTLDTATGLLQLTTNGVGHGALCVPSESLRPLRELLSGALAFVEKRLAEQDAIS